MAGFSGLAGNAVGRRLLQPDALIRSRRHDRRRALVLGCVKELRFSGSPANKPLKVSPEYSDKRFVRKKG
jgi:hypothetical protein